MDVTNDLQTATLIKGRSLWREALGRLFSNRGSLAGVIILMLLVIIALLAPVISPQHTLLRYGRFRTGRIHPRYLRRAYLFTSRLYCGCHRVISGH